MSMNERSTQTFTWAHPLEPELPSANTDFLNISHIRLNVFKAMDLHSQVSIRKYFQTNKKLFIYSG